MREAVERTPGAVLLGDVDEIAVMFDKRLCHARLSAAGVPVPPALPGPVEDYRSLRERMDRAGWGRVFVKPAHWLVGVRGDRPARRREPGPGGDVGGAVLGELYNSLRVRRYEDEADLAVIVDRLAGDGLHVERWFPKAGMDGLTFDLRVVVVAGRPTHAVVRASRAP
nr:hypothetical protein GCM10020093_003470 [Planobispora longispora]